MGNCCAATPTSDSHRFAVANEHRNPIPAAGHAHQHNPHAHHSPGRQNAALAGGGHATPDSLAEISIPAEPQQLEHIADREGNILTVQHPA